MFSHHYQWNVILNITTKNNEENYETDNKIKIVDWLAKWNFWTYDELQKAASSIESLLQEKLDWKSQN